VGEKIQELAGNAGSEIATMLSGGPMWLWGVISVLGLVMGARWTKNASMTTWMHVTSLLAPGEVVGIMGICGGVLAFANGLAMMFDWSYASTSLIAGGALATIFSFGIASEAASKRKEDKEDKTA